MKDQIISQSASPSINIGTPAQAPEPLVIGNANTLFRLCGTLLVFLIALLVWAAVEVRDQANTIGRLEEKVLFLEDIVINKTYKVERKTL